MKQAELFNFNKEQINEIHLAAKKKLNITPMLNRDFKRPEMIEIRLGLEHNLTTEQVKLFADSNFNAVRMKQIRLGLEQGLTIEQVKSYTKKEYTALQMRAARKALEIGVPFEQINIIIKEFTPLNNDRYTLHQKYLEERLSETNKKKLKILLNILQKYEESSFEQFNNLNQNDFKHK